MIEGLRKKISKRDVMENFSIKSRPFSENSKIHNYSFFLSGWMCWAC